MAEQTPINREDRGASLGRDDLLNDVKGWQESQTDNACVARAVCFPTADFALSAHGQLRRASIFNHGCINYAPQITFTDKQAGNCI